jgi:peptide/nickel transport system permease protein
MGAFTLRRIAQAIPTMLIVTMVSFFLVHIVPGGPAQAMLGPKATVERIAAINREFGLTQPLYVQYVQWLYQLVRGNLGVSYFQNMTVAQLFALDLPRTLAIVALAVLISHLLSVIVGSVQAYWRDTWFDHIVTTVMYFFYSMPVFWLAIIVLVFFSVDLNMFPSGGISTLGEPQTFGTWVSHVTLPILTLVVASVAGWARFMRTSMIDGLVQDYVRTARAKGVGEFLVVFKHALRNSILPLITLFGYNIPGLFGGALLIEVVFNYPGMGLLLYNAAIQRDYPIVMAGVVVGGALTVIGNLIADLLYGIADPRIRYD